MRAIHYTVLISLVNVLIALGALVATYYNVLDWMIVFMTIAVLVDMIDGVVARRSKRTDLQKKEGIIVDSLADMATFVVAPSVIVLLLAGANMWSAIVVFLLVVCGGYRLVHFTALSLQSPRSSRSFIGMPVVVSAFALMIWYALDVSVDYLLLLLAVAACTMVTSVRIPKPGIRGLLCVACVMIALAVYALWR